MKSNGNRAVLNYGLLTAGVLLIALLGFQAFRAFLDLQTTGFETTSLLLLSVVAGVASFFSPCSFPLLLTLLGRGTADHSGDSPRQLLARAAALSLGVSAFLLLLGAALAVGAGAWFRQVTFVSQGGRLLRAAVGGALILLGLGQLGVFHLPFHSVGERTHRLLHRQEGVRSARPLLGFGLYGFFYVLAGFG